MNEIRWLIGINGFLQIIWRSGNETGQKRKKL